MLQFRTEYVHLTSILKNDLIVQLHQSLLSLSCMSILNKCFPYLGLLEDEDLDDGTMRAEKLVEIIMSDDVSKLVVNAHQKNRTFRGMVFVTTHVKQKINKYSTAFIHYI